MTEVANIGRDRTGRPPVVASPERGGPSGAAPADRLHRVALVRLSALGDVTLLLPVVRTLQQAVPGVEITWITGTGAYQLLEGIRGVEFVVIDKPRRAGDYRRFGRTLEARRFDVVLAAQANLRANLLYPWIRAGRKIGFDRARAREGQWVFTDERIPFAKQHLLDSFFSLLEAQGIRDRVLDWDLPLTDADHAWAAEHTGDTGRRLLVVNPGASKIERIWHADRYIETIRAAQDRWDVTVVLTGDRSATERGLGAYIQSQVENGVINLVGQTTPKQLAAVIGRSDCVLAPDTGPVHIAVAMDTPVVGLYAVAPSWLSGPYRYRELVVDRYDEAVRKILGRDPATVPWGTRVHSNLAMGLIEVPDVIASLEKVFGA